MLYLYPYKASEEFVKYFFLAGDLYKLYSIFKVN